MNLENFRKELVLSDSNEFLYMVERKALSAVCISLVSFWEELQCHHGSSSCW
jgi:hypothetical protein